MLSRPRAHAAAASLLLVLLALLVGSMLDESPTTDEPFHMTRGLAWFWSPDTSLSYAHPPLANALLAAPVALTQPPVEMASLPGYSRRSVESMADALLSRHYEQRRGWLFAMRLGGALLTLCTALYIYRFCLRLWGPPSALGALFFVALSPTLIAHGRLMTTDAPVACAMVVALGELILFIEGRAKLRLLTTALATGAAMAAKFTGLVLLPLFGVFLLGASGLRVGRYAERSRPRALASAGLALSFIVLSGLFVVSASYRFDDTGLTVREILDRPEPVNTVTRSYRGRMLEQVSPLRHLPSELRVPLPYTYLYGLTSIGAHNAMGHRTVFFGKVLVHGSPWYFPVLMAIKTPGVELLMLAYGAFALLRRRRWPSLPATLLSLAALVILGLSMRAQINIGVRHVLVLFPLLGMLAGRALGLACEAIAARRERLFLAGLLGAHAASMSWAFPDYLSDFNLLVLGRTYGQRVSIVGEEWGQDKVRLARACQRLGIKALRYATEPQITRQELARYGIRLLRMPCSKRRAPPGYSAVSARELARDLAGCYAWTRERQPILDLSGHIYVYAPDPAATK